MKNTNYTLLLFLVVVTTVGICQGAARAQLTTTVTPQTNMMQNALRALCTEKKIAVDELKMRQPVAYANELHETEKITEDDLNRFYTAIGQRRFSLSTSSNPEPYDP